MRYLHLIPVPDKRSFAKHADNLKLQTEIYLHSSGHQVDTLILDDTFDDIGWCEELIYELNIRGEFTGYDHIIFSHSDVIIHEMNFLEYADNNHAFGRPFYFVCSVEMINRLCEVELSYVYKEKTYPIESIFHSPKITALMLGNKRTSIPEFKEHVQRTNPELLENLKTNYKYKITTRLLFDGDSYNRYTDIDHADHIFYLNYHKKLRVPLKREGYYDRLVPGIEHFVGCGAGYKTLTGQSQQALADALDQFEKNSPDERLALYRLNGILKYVCHGFRYEEFTKEDIVFIKTLIDTVIEKNVTSKNNIKNTINKFKTRKNIELNNHVIHELVSHCK